MKQGHVLTYSFAGSSAVLTITRESAACDSWRAVIRDGDRVLYKGRQLGIDSAQRRAQLWAIRNGISGVIIPAT